MEDESFMDCGWLYGSMGILYCNNIWSSIVKTVPYERWGTHCIILLKYHLVKYTIDYLSIFILWYSLLYFLGGILYLFHSKESIVSIYFIILFSISRKFFIFPAKINKNGVDKINFICYNGSISKRKGDNNYVVSCK